MHEAASTPTVHEVLLALEELLTHETQALIRLDPEAVEATSKRKRVLTESLAAFDQSFSREERLRLTKIRTKIRNNLVLLAQAREYVQLTVRTITGQPPTLDPTQTQSTSSTLLDVRG